MSLKGIEICLFTIPINIIYLMLMDHMFNKLTAKSEYKFVQKAYALRLDEEVKNYSLLFRILY